MGFVLSMAIVLPVLDLGLSEDETGVTELKDTARRVLGDADLTWHVSYRVRLGVR